MCDLKIENVKNVNLTKGEAFVKCVVSLSWYDSRLSFYQPNKDLPENLWTPVATIAEATGDCKMQRIAFGLVPGSVEGKLFTKTVFEGTISLTNTDEEIGWYPYDHHNIKLTLCANMTSAGEKMKMANKLDWRLLSSKNSAVDALYLQEYDYYGYYMRYKEPEMSKFDTLETGLFIKRRSSNQIMNLVWLMTFVALLALNGYYIYDNVVDKVAHVNTLFVIVVLCLSATTLMAPRQRAGQSTASKMSTAPVVLLVVLQAFLTYEYQNASDLPKL
jgi:hypothetical protein